MPSSGKAGLRVTVATFAVSAFWHGFYPGYYIFFVFLALTQEVARGMLLLPPHFSSLSPLCSLSRADHFAKR